MSGPAPRRLAAEQRGHWGERRAALWLKLHGWRLLTTRAKVRQGEVDLIARRGRVLIFVEVKTRATAAELDLAIDRNRLKRVAAAAHALSPKYARATDTIRIDVILIAPRRWPRWLKNVWSD